MAEQPSMGNSSEDGLARVKYVSSGVDTDTLSKWYGGWAGTFDQDVLMYHQGNPHRILAHCTAKTFESRKDVRILDLAAGTGMVGQELGKQGFTNVDAIDASEEMLKKAKEKGVYKSIICDFLGKNKLDIADGTYDALVASGAFIPNHVTMDSLEELIRITKPGGNILLLINEMYLLNPNQFKDILESRMQELHESGSWCWGRREVHPEYLKHTPGVLFYFRVL